MTESPFKMGFDPGTIKHLGLRMYSTLPPAIAEIISNSYDADATNVTIRLTESDGHPEEIAISDDGIGLSFEEINSKFLIIGRDRRSEEGDNLSLKHKRLPTGKKGLGKLALFGLADTITVLTRQNGRENEFILDWDDLNASKGDYRPQATKRNKETDQTDGTIITLKSLKRKTPFDAPGLADSLARIFIFDKTFKLVIEDPTGDKISIDNKRKYDQLDEEFKWDLEDTLMVPKASEYSGKMKGALLTSEKPLAPGSGLRGITLFSRGKLVNMPESFSISTSSHFYQYLTGWISVDFVDLLDEDVISTNRQSIDWEHPEMAKLRIFLSEMVSRVRADWRKKRTDRKDEVIKEETGIDAKEWVATMPEGVKENMQHILDTLGGEDALEKFPDIIGSLHKILPEYPELHWRHLHDDIRDRVKPHYVNKQYGVAASQGVQIYCEIIRKMTGSTKDGFDLVNRAFGSRPFAEPPTLQLNNLNTDSEKNIQEGQGQLSRGIVTGFRNPITHDPIDTTVPAVFSELDCLNILSLASYLVTRMDGAKVNAPKKPKQ